MFFVKVVLLFCFCVWGWGLLEVWWEFKLRSVYCFWFWFLVFDEGYWWVCCVVWVVEFWYWEELFDVIVVIGGFFLMLFVGLWMKWCIGKFLIVDLCDFWIGNLCCFLCSWYVVWCDLLEVVWERWCLESVDVVVCVNCEMMDLLVCVFKGCLEIIGNGFDLEDFGGVVV